MEVVALIIAVMFVALAAFARDIAIRAFADRADSRVQRVVEAEWKADAATKAVEELGKKVRELEKLSQAQIARAVRR